MPGRRGAHRFASGRPDWEAGGALFVKDVAPYEKMKLRMLNGAHSLLAYSGFIAGHAYVRDTMADADLTAVVARHMVEAAKTLNTLQPVPPASNRDGLASTKPLSGEVGHNPSTVEPDCGPRPKVSP